MNRSLFLNAPLQSVFWSNQDTVLKHTLLILVGVFVLAFSAQLVIPLQPVPLTFQSATVILIGMTYGARYGSYTIAAYIFTGLIGLPVFENFSSGIVKFQGPTAGYLFGFLPAAFLSGLLAQYGFAKNIFTSFLVACLGAAVIFACGTFFLARMIGWDDAIAFGLTPFVLSEVIKLIAVACFVPRLWK